MFQIRSQIRIRICKLRKGLDLDPDLYIKYTDPQHWLAPFLSLASLCSFFLAVTKAFGLFAPAGVFVRA